MTQKLDKCRRQLFSGIEQQEAQSLEEGKLTAYVHSGLFPRFQKAVVHAECHSPVDLRGRHRSLGILKCMETAHQGIGKEGIVLDGERRNLYGSSHEFFTEDWDTSSGARLYKAYYGRPEGRTEVPEVECYWKMLEF